MTLRTLVIVRHAKAADSEGRADRDRPLTPRGHADSAAAGAWLAHHGFVPDLVLCSPARRTRETWHGIAVALATAAETTYDNELYGGDAHSIVDLITASEDRFGTVAVVGHNPAVSGLSALLDPAHADPEGLRTCGIAVHTVTGAWADCGPGQAPLTQAHTARA